MANRTLALIRKMLNFAVERDWIDANPTALIPKPGVERSRDRVLTHDEIRAFWQATENEPLPIRASMRLRLLTAQRGDKVVRMQWSDLDLISKWWDDSGGHRKERAHASCSAERRCSKALARASSDGCREGCLGLSRFAYGYAGHPRREKSSRPPSTTTRASISAATISDRTLRAS